MKEKRDIIYNTFYYRFYDGEKVINYPKELLQSIFKRLLKGLTLDFILLDENWKDLTFYFKKDNESFESINLDKFTPIIIEELYDLCLFLPD